MYTRLKPDYGPYSNNGFVLGADYTRLMRFISPSLEVRYKYTTGKTVGERTFGGGLRIEHRFAAFHPYADFLVSTGTITFADPHNIGSFNGSNHSIVYSYGGGLDYNITPRWGARVDYQGESWNLHEIPNVTLAPTALSLGVVYHIRPGRQ